MTHHIHEQIKQRIPMHLSQVVILPFACLTTFRRDSKQSLYPEVDFPGSHYTKGNTLPWLNGGFTFSELLDKNIESFGGNIFLGGKLNFDDTQYNEKYEETPHGLVRRIEKRTLSTESGNASISAEHYRLKSQQAWSIVSKYLSSNLPTEEKYPPSTWEWTIRREFFDHLVSRSTYLLDMAIRDSSDSTQHRMLPSLVESAAWLELASSWDEAYSNPSPSMKKNLGLAYMHIVRNQEQGGFPYVEDIFDVSYGNTTRGDSQKPHRHNWWTKKTDNLDDSWKGWATTRWQEEWGTFLKIESSRAEPGYDQVKSIYQSVMKASSSKANSRR